MKRCWISPYKFKRVSMAEHVLTIFWAIPAILQNNMQGPWNLAEIRQDLRDEILDTGITCLNKVGFLYL